MLKSEKSMSVASEKLAEAQALLKSGFESSAVVSAYASMFHAGRALLFKDGIIEKSHYCLIEYLRETYVKTGKMPAEAITVMDAFREERHEVMYSLEGIKIKQKVAQTAIDNAKALIDAVKPMLKP
ncbi:MAG TPA: HEPN domain-containing protein [Candidatus Micrarchaeota archaeon]|nr:HEPN domain-containing protein [Candidatus Micrarchaeota archaeon]